MIKTKRRVKFTLPYCLLVVVLCLTFNAIAAWSDGIRMLSIAVGCMIPVLICRSFFNTNLFVWLFFYFVIVFFNFFAHDAYFSNLYALQMGLAGFLISSSLTYYVYKRSDYNLLWLILVIVFIVTIWTTIATAYYDSMYPGLVRMSTDARRNGGADWSMYNQFYRMGLSDYATPHAYPILIPPLVYGIKNALGGKQKMIYIIMLMSCLMLVYFSGATGPMVVSIMILIMSLLAHNGGWSSNTATFLVLLIFVPVLVSDELLLSILEWFDGLIGGEGAFHAKIIDFEDSILYNQSYGDVAARQDLYTTSLMIFFEHPILGTQNPVGGHSALLDRFASLGFIGIVPFIAILIVQAKFVKKYIPQQGKIYYLLGYIAALTMLISKGFCGWHFWFFLFSILPFIITYVSIKHSHNQIQS